MSLLEIIVLGLALSMDAFAVTLSNLCAYPHLSRARRIVLPVVFGVFQGLMPLIGYFIGSLAAEIVDAIAGPLALVLLAFIGGKMIFESAVKLRKAKNKETSCAPESPESPAATLTFPAILVQGLATSLDALIVGISLLALGVNIALASSLIAITTFVCCVVALIIGKRIGLLLGDKAQIVGGIVLIIIGIKACFF